MLTTDTAGDVAMEAAPNDTQTLPLFPLLPLAVRLELEERIAAAEGNLTAARTALRGGDRDAFRVYTAALAKHTRRMLTVSAPAVTLVAVR